MRVSMMSLTSTICTMVEYAMWTWDCRHTGSSAGLMIISSGCSNYVY